MPPNGTVESAFCSANPCLKFLVLYKLELVLFNNRCVKIGDQWSCDKRSAPLAINVTTFQFECRLGGPDSVIEAPRYVGNKYQCPTQGSKRNLTKMCKRKI